MALFHAYTQTVADGTATSVVRPSDWNSGHVQAMTISGNTAGQSSFTGTNIVFHGGNNVTLSANTAAGAATVIVSGPNVSQYLTTAMQSNAGSAFVATSQSSLFQHTSATTAIVSDRAYSTHSHGVTLNLTNINGTTGGNSNGINLSLSAVVPAQTVQPVAFSASGGSSNFSTLSFSNQANGVTFSNSAGQVAMSHSLQQLSNTSAITASAMNTSERNNYFYTSNNTFAPSTHSHGMVTTTTNGSLVTVAGNSGGYTLAVPPFVTAAAGGGDGYNSAQFTNSTANSTMPIVWAGNSNGSGNITLGLTGSTVTMSAPSGGAGVAISAGANSQNTGTVAFSNSNGISFGLNAGTVTASYTVPTQTVDTNKAGTGFTSTTTAGVNVVGTLNTNGLSLGVPAYLTTYVNDLTSGRAGTGFTSTTTAGAVPTATLNTNGLSFGMPAYITTYAAQTAQPVAFSAGAASSNFSTLSFQDSNGVSFSNNAGAIRVSHGLQYTSNTSAIVSDRAYSTHTHGNPTLNLTNINGTTASASNGLTLSLSAVVPAQTNQTANFYVSGNTTQLSSTAGIDLRSVSFEGAGIASVGVSNGRVLVSVPSGGGAGDGYNIVQAGTVGTTGTVWSSLSGTVRINGSNNITVSQNNSNDIVILGNTVPDFWSIQGNTAGASNTYAWTNDGLYLAGGNNITLSQNGSTLTIVGAAGGAGATNAGYIPFPNGISQALQLGQASMFFAPLPDVGAFSHTKVYLPVQFSNASNSSNSVTFTLAVGLYTLNGVSLSLYGSTSTTGNYAASGTVGNYSLVAGIRNFGIPWNATHSAGNYWYAVVSSTVTGGGAGQSLSNIVMSQLNSTHSGEWAVASNATAQALPFLGRYTSAGTVFPNAVQRSEIQGNSSAFQRMPIIWWSP